MLCDAHTSYFNEKNANAQRADVAGVLPELQFQFEGSVAACATHGPLGLSGNAHSGSRMCSVWFANGNSHAASVARTAPEGQGPVAKSAGVTPGQSPGQMETSTSCTILLQCALVSK